MSILGGVYLSTTPRNQRHSCLGYLPDRSFLFADNLRPPSLTNPLTLNRRRVEALPLYHCCHVRLLRQLLYPDRLSN